MLLHIILTKHVRKSKRINKNTNWINSTKIYIEISVSKTLNYNKTIVQNANS